MKYFGRAIVKLRFIILIVAGVLLIPAAGGFFATRINYDILYYLPGDIDTMIGQDILLDDFGKGAYALVLVQNMKPKQVNNLENTLKDVEHVEQIISYNSLVGPTVPMEMIPEKYVKEFYNSDTDTTMFVVFFDDTTSSDETMDAITEIREITDYQVYISGMSAVVTDTKKIVMSEMARYIIVAAVFVIIIVALQSISLPFILVATIEFAIFINMAVPYYMGTEIPFISSVVIGTIQLGATVDYAILMSTRYKKERFEGKGKHDSIYYGMRVAIP
ncbi:MAG: MMPL family transporter [Lachnospiraceae bacterium]|nr:MMPL family transporter [Lachnospiraceae bacterium]